MFCMRNRKKHFNYIYILLHASRALHNLQSIPLPQFFHTSLSPDSFQIRNEPQQVISYNVVCATKKGSDQPAHTHSLIRAFASRLNIL